MVSLLVRDAITPYKAMVCICTMGWSTLTPWLDLVIPWMDLVVTITLVEGCSELRILLFGTSRLELCIYLELWTTL